MRTLTLALFAGLALSGCRSRIDPLVKTEPVRQKVRQAPGECHVNDYPQSTDVPEKSQNIGRVSVARGENDDATSEAMRKAICEKGGDGMSQCHWIRAPGASVADPPVELECNAWILP